MTDQADTGQVRPPSRPALSPSRAADFKQCPLLYRFRAIDRLPEAASAAQLRGSLVHAALERLYALPATQRDADTARSLVEPAWDRMIAEEPALAAELDPALRPQLFEEARALLSGYYRLEDPTRFEPDSCEQRVEVELEDGTLLRGFIDRIDVAATGELRVVDYKTGKAPPAARAPGRVQGDVPDEVLRGGTAAVAWRAGRPAAADLPRRRASCWITPRTATSCCASKRR